MKQAEINKESYNSIISDWNSYRNKTTINNCIKEFCKSLPKHAHILDIGCGTGYPIDSFLCQSGFSIVGIDISDKMIANAKKRHLSNAIFIEKDFLYFTSTEKFDAIIAFDSIWHIEESQQEKIYKMVSSLLNPNGYFLFTHGKNAGTIVGNMFSHEFIYSALGSKKVKSILNENSMDIIFYQEDYEEKTTGKRDLLIIAKKRN